MADEANDSTVPPPPTPPTTTEQSSYLQQDLTLKKIFVGSLSKNVNEEDLINYFSRFGKVVEVEVIKDRYKKSCGFGFVIFNSRSAFDTALMEEHYIGGEKIKIEKAIPQEKNKQQQQGNKRGGGGGCMRRGRGNGHRSNPYQRRTGGYSQPKNAINIYMN